MATFQSVKQLYSDGMKTRPSSSTEKEKRTFKLAENSDYYLTFHDDWDLSDYHLEVDPNPPALRGPWMGSRAPIDNTQPLPGRDVPEGGDKLYLAINTPTVEKAAPILYKKLKEIMNSKGEMPRYPRSLTLRHDHEPDGVELGPMFILLAAIHDQLKNDKKQNYIPDSVTSRELAKIIDYANIYDLIPLLKPYLGKWMRGLRDEQRKDENFEFDPSQKALQKRGIVRKNFEIAWCAQELGAAEIYKDTITKLAVTFAPFEFEIDFEEKRIEDLRKSVIRARDAALGMIGARLEKARTNASQNRACILKLNQTTEEGRKKCNLGVLHGMKQIIDSRGINFDSLVESKTNLFDYGSILFNYHGNIEQILELDCSEHHVHRPCDPIQLARRELPPWADLSAFIFNDLQDFFAQRARISGLDALE